MNVWRGEESIATGCATTEPDHIKCQYKKIFDLNPEGMVIVDVSSGQIENANAAFCTLMGKSATQLCGFNLADHLAPAQEERFAAGCRVCSNMGQGTIGGVGIMVQGTERLFDITTTYYDFEDGQRRVCLSFKGISEKHELERRLTDAAQKDALTGLYNQRSFHMHIEAAVTAAKRHALDLVLMMIDLDNFKNCNDKHGHQTGDLVLKMVGRLIMQNIRGGHDEGFRCGGDEFVILLRDGTVEAGLRIGERIQQVFSEMLNYGTSMSIGIAKYEQGLTAKALLNVADRALYRAKLTGKSCIVVLGAHESATT